MVRGVVDGGWEVCGERRVTKSLEYVRRSGVWQAPPVAGKMLWSGAHVMNASQTIELAEAIPDQLSGIALVWSRFFEGAVNDSRYSTDVVPKHVFGSGRIGNGRGWVFKPELATDVSKYLYISPTFIVGYAGNSAGVNGGAVLRYVIGV